MQTTKERVSTMDRDQFVTALRVALKSRSKTRWSIRCGRGTSWGWVMISASSKRSDTPEERDELAGLLSLPASMLGLGGVLIEPKTLLRAEYLDRAEGRAV